MQTEVLELFYVDDMAKNALTERKTLKAVDRVSQAVTSMISKSAQKDRDCVQPVPGKPYNQPTITVWDKDCKLLINSPWKYFVKSSAH